MPPSSESMRTLPTGEQLHVLYGDFSMWAAVYNVLCCLISPVFLSEDFQQSSFQNVTPCLLLSPLWIPIIIMGEDRGGQGTPPDPVKANHSSG